MNLETNHIVLKRPQGTELKDGTMLHSTKVANDKNNVWEV